MYAQLGARSDAFVVSTMVACAIFVDVLGSRATSALMFVIATSAFTSGAAGVAAIGCTGAGSGAASGKFGSLVLPESAAAKICKRNPPTHEVE